MVQPKSVTRIKLSLVHKNNEKYDNLWVEFFKLVLVLIFPVTY